MTNAMRQWLEEIDRIKGKGALSIIGNGESYVDVLRAFCDKVERRAAKKDDPDAVWMAYEALKRELLGGRDAE